MGNASSVPFEHGWDGPPGDKRTRREFWPMMREYCPQASWNPVVPQGQGVGRFGKDSTDRSILDSSRHICGKTTQQRNIEEYFSSTQVQAIMKKYDISKEHPGLEYAPSIYREYEGSSGPTSMYLTPFNIPVRGLIRRMGPAYHDSPEGTKCHEKLIAMEKYTIYFTTFYFVHRMAILKNPANRQEFWQGAKNVYRYPIMCSAAFAFSSCYMCALRGKDDPWNYMWGGFFAGVPVWITSGRPFYGVTAGCWFAALASLYKTATEFEEGVETSLHTSLLPSERYKNYDRKSWTTDWWKDWFTLYMPPSDEHGMQLRKIYGIPEDA